MIRSRISPHCNAGLWRTRQDVEVEKIRSVQVSPMVSGDAPIDDKPEGFVMSSCPASAGEPLIFPSEAYYTFWHPCHSFDWYERQVVWSYFLFVDMNRSSKMSLICCQPRNGHRRHGCAGRIADVGSRETDRRRRADCDRAASAGRIIDARGQVVAPGFIDVHTHADGWLLENSAPVPQDQPGIHHRSADERRHLLCPSRRRTVAIGLLPARAQRLEQEDYRGWRTIADYLALLDRRTVQNVIAEIPYAKCACWPPAGTRAARRLAIKIMRHESSRRWTPATVGISTGWITSPSASPPLTSCGSLLGHAPWRGLYVRTCVTRKGTLAGVQEAVEIGRGPGCRCIFRISRPGPRRRPTRSRPTSIASPCTRSISRSTSIPICPARRCPLLAALRSLGTRPAGGRGPSCAIRQRARAANVCWHVSWCRRRRSRWPGLRRKTTCATRANRSPSTRPHTAAAGGRRGVRPVDRGEPGGLVRAETGDELVEPFLQHPKFMLGTDGIYFRRGLVHPCASMARRHECSGRWCATESCFRWKTPSAK